MEQGEFHNARRRSIEDVIWSLHVDDFVGGGQKLNGDFHHEFLAGTLHYTFLARMEWLSKRFLNVF